MAKGPGGWVTVCSSCRKVDDPRGNWVTPETYLRNRVRSAIRHTLCPACAAKLYPAVVERLPEGEPPPARAAGATPLVLCANCKGIEEEVGWTPLEDALSDRFGIRIIRSLCLICIRQQAP